MAEIHIEKKRRDNLMPWLIGLAILVIVVGWLIWRNNRLPVPQGRRDLPADVLPADLLPADLLPADLLPADLLPADTVLADTVRAA